MSPWFQFSAFYRSGNCITLHIRRWGSVTTHGSVPAGTCWWSSCPLSPFFGGEDRTIRNHGPHDSPVTRRFQFSLGRIFLAMALVAIGLGLFRLPNPFPRLMPIWFPFSCALFGAAIGLVCGRVKRFALYGFVGAVAFGIYAWIA
ncbi:MAG TPA: hypothetical protein VHC22_14255 [Pirellulales bacterium]|nr:hypothetical protein [Pirellulales bacterium]